MAGGYAWPMSALVSSLARPVTGSGRALLGLFLVSGFCGLIYQSIWAHYLGLTLGHAAYAQSLVLAIFMGGMALGAWAASRWGGRLRDLVLAYALAEALIGLAGLGFHPLFVAYAGWSQDSVLPALSASAVPWWQWGSAAALILPQCVLLGATFPLLSAGGVRLWPERAGRLLGGLYFANSFGAAAGALLATFWLLPRLGMPGAMSVAGGLNLAVALAAVGLARRLPAAPPAAMPRAVHATGGAALSALQRRVLLATALSGACSFVYEIVWVRLLNQALGTTLHSFELMLAAFILGLAFGGAVVRWRGERWPDALRVAAFAQIAMGVAALLSAPVFTRSFVWVGALLDVLPRDDGGYVLFNLGSAAIALSVMFPAAFFAGMTLPLFTLALLRRGAGEPAIGRVYAANTLGAIVGVFAAVHALVPAIGLHGALLAAASGDVLIGFWLLRRTAFRLRWRAPVAAVALAFAVALVFGRPDPLAQVSGVFRTGKPRADREAEVVFLRDGKTATVAVTRYPSNVAMIATNGKPDASLALAPDIDPTPDEITMLMAGALPLALLDQPRRVAVIGWGSGLTTHTLLGDARVAEVESIEIERAMVEGAREFGMRVERAYADPRSRLRIDDARTRFASGRLRYDAIVSEPSNPWVSGVAHLFTGEFYTLLHRRLADDGVLVQWVQSYEIDDALLARMVAALLGRFPGAEAYLTNDYDLLLMAPRDGNATTPTLARLDGDTLRAELDRVGLAGDADLRLRRIGGDRVLRTFARLFGAQGHSDFHPVVALAAPRTRFLGARSEFLQYLVDNGLPVLDLLDGRVPPARGTIRHAGHSRFAWAQRIAGEVVGSLEDGATREWLRNNAPAQAVAVARLLALSAQPLRDADISDWGEALAATAKASLGQLPAGDHAASWIAPGWHATGSPRAAEVLAAYAAAARRDPAAMFATAVVALESAEPRWPQPLREQLLVIAQLGALGEGDTAALALLESRYGDYAGRSRDFDGIRHFLRVWAADTAAE